MREVVLDTETTGLSPRSGDRLVEIGCVELINRFPTGRTYHAYVNPERDMPDGAFAVHGLSAEFLSTKPRFVEVVDAFLDFIADAPLVIHNAEFDMGFIDMELEKAGRQALGLSRSINTLSMARRKHPGASAKLDDLCKRYGVDNSRRTKHGALLDAELLAEVYVELAGGRQASLTLATDALQNNGADLRSNGPKRTAEPRPVPLASTLSAEEAEAHAAFVATLGPEAVWKRWN
jgi:DNA polymerase-3 subunit epsilon